MPPTIIKSSRSKPTVHSPETLFGKVQSKHKTDTKAVSTAHKVVFTIMIAMPLLAILQFFLKYYFPQTVFMLIVIPPIAYLIFFFVKNK